MTACGTLPPHRSQTCLGRQRCQHVVWVFHRTRRSVTMRERLRQRRRAMPFCHEADGPRIPAIRTASRPKVGDYSIIAGTRMTSLFRRTRGSSSTLLNELVGRAHCETSSTSSKASALHGLGTLTPGTAPSSVDSRGCEFQAAVAAGVWSSSNSIGVSLPSARWRRRRW